MHEQQRLVFSSVALSVWLFATPWTAANQASLSITNSESLLKLMSIELVMSFNHLILSLSSPSPPIFNLSQHQGLCKWVSSSHQVVKALEFQLQISPSNEHSGFISFRMDWLDLLAVQGTLKTPLPTPQFKRINSLALSFLYSPNLTSIHDHWKNHSLTRWTFVGKVMSLLFNMLSRLVITFLPRSKHQVGFRKHDNEQSSWRWWNSSWAISNPKRWCCESAALDMPARLVLSYSKIVILLFLFTIIFSRRVKIQKETSVFQNSTHYCYL